MKRTPLYETHCASGATIAPYAAWEMPISYAGAVAEVEATRHKASVFDVSHMGQFRVAGPGSISFLQSLTSNNIARLAPGQAQYSLLLNPDGGVIDDIIVYELAGDDFLIVVNAGCKEKDWEWFKTHVGGGANVLLTDESDHTALIAVQGPRAVEVVNELSVSRQLGSLARFEFHEEIIAEVRTLAARTGYTGEDGVELFCAWDDANALWNAVVKAGATPAGLAARDVLRLEAAYPLYGHELLPNVNPFESGVGWAVRTKKGEFIGRDAVVAARAAGLSQRLVGLRMVERAIPRDEYAVLAASTEPIGSITSGTFSPTMKAGIAMARVQLPYAMPGTDVLVDIRGRRAGAVIVDLPFYRNGV